MGEGCVVALKDGADRNCTDNGILSLREIKSGADEDGKHRELLPQNGHEKKDDISPKHVNLWEYNGGKISGASKSLIHTTKEEHKVPKEKLAEEFAQLSASFDRQMLQREQKRKKKAAEGQ
jgi:hypothetical protein